MARYVQTYQTHTPSTGVESSVAWESRPYNKQAEVDNPRFQTIATGLTAAGTDLATGLQLAAKVNVIATATSGTGVVLPAGVAGDIVYIRNSGASTINIFPTTVGKINGGSDDAAITLATTKAVLLVATGTNLWYSLPGA